MIPIKLELKNFLSYGDSIVKVDFENHSLICLSGKNGNGKSALLDAMTWALWGIARKVSGTGKADAGLMRLGQTRMIVSFEFFCNGQRYRVRREYTKTYGKPITKLNVELFDETKERFISLIENTVRQTQAKIEKIIGLDFETFINSAFLRQGQSNEFSKKTPKERKQILANILGLSRYDELSKRALEHARTHNDERKLLDRMQEQVALELEKEKEVKIFVDEKEKALKALSKELTAAAKTLEAQEKANVVFLQQKYQLEQLIKQEKMFIATVTQKQKELRGVVGQWRTVHAESLQLPDVKALELSRKKLLEKEQSFRITQAKQIALQEKIMTKKEVLQKQIMSCRRSYETGLAKHALVLEKAELSYKQLIEQGKQKELLIEQNKKKQHEVQEKIKAIAKELVGYKAFEKEYARVKEQFEKRRVFYQTLVQQGNWVQKELAQLEQKTITVQDRDNPSCPLCEQVLTLNRKQFLAKAFTKQKVFFTHRLARITRLIKSLKLLLLEQHKQVKTLSFRDDRYKQLSANEAAFTKSLADLTADLTREVMQQDVATVRVKKEERELATLRKTFADEQKKEDDVLKKDKTVIKLEAELEVLTKEQADLKYDKKAHDALAQKLKTCEKHLGSLDEFKTRFARQDERKRSISRLCSELKALATQVATLIAKREEMGFDGEGEKKLAQQITDRKHELTRLGKAKELLLQEKGRLETKVQRFATLKKEQDERKGAIAVSKTQAKEYQVLGGAFGKDGIQALLIEQAIPEIEAEANALLSRLTDNTSQVFIESLRDLKKGGVKESLDIHISDAHGIRPYEMFSGGEAFRIDFSLRIAISKLLARRAGTALQTLIIDEGFGSQDEDGLQRLMDAIHAIRKDFLKIIVVSHLPIFKDNFPVHFIVEKDSLGSFVRVEERG